MLNSIKLKKIANACLPPIIWALVIFVFSAQSMLPGFNLAFNDFILKKVAHLTVYAILYLLIYRSVLILNNQQKLKSTKYYIIPFLLILVYAGSDEIHQLFVPGRYATLRDVGYDALGGLIAFLRIYRYI